MHQLRACPLNTNTRHAPPEVPAFTDMLTSTCVTGTALVPADCDHGSQEYILQPLLAVAHSVAPPQLPHCWLPYSGPHNDVAPGMDVNGHILTAGQSSLYWSGVSSLRPLTGLPTLLDVFSVSSDRYEGGATAVVPQPQEALPAALRCVGTADRATVTTPTRSSHFLVALQRL